MSFLSLKNTLINSYIPQKTNKEKNIIPESSPLGPNDRKGPPKEIIFEITSPLTLSFEGEIDR